MSRAKSIKQVKNKKKRTDSATVGARISIPCRKKIERLAYAEGVGVSTYVRLILERYVEDHAPWKRVGKFSKRKKLK